jgi:uncharacterized repeat protein (TIGR03803 family)
MPCSRTSSIPRFAVASAVLLLVSVTGVAKSQETVVHRFTGEKDGSKPLAGLVADAAGNLYGTTFYGGTGKCNDGNEFFGCGTVFEVSLNSQGGWSETVLYSFQNAPDQGVSPKGGVVRDSAGNLYGTTYAGGSAGCTSGGCGTVFELTPPLQAAGQWTETILYSFQGGSDGRGPSSDLLIDQNGTIYGTTAFGGDLTGVCDNFPGGCGTVFRMTSNSDGTWTHTVLYRFQPTDDGQEPLGGLVMDVVGNLYGTTYQGGYYSTYCGSGCGTVFQLAPPSKNDGSWTEQILLRFSGTNGGAPLGDLILDDSENLYGTTTVGLDENGEGVFNGNIYRLSPPSQQGGQWSQSVLYLCPAYSGPGSPGAGVIRDKAGYLYGTTVAGGSTQYGAVFQLAPPPQQGSEWIETTLHVFQGGSDGMYPEAGLVFGPNHQVYGTTYGGADSKCSPEGYDTCGMIFGVTYP